MAQLRRWLPLLVVAALVALIAGAASVVDLRATNVDPTMEWLQPDAGGTPSASESPSPEPASVTATPGLPMKKGVHPFFYILIFTIITFVFGILAVVLFFAIRAFIRSRRANGPPVLEFAEQAAYQDAEVEEVRAVVRAGLADIDEGGDPRRAVIACWLGLEKAAARAGTERLVSETPGDLVTRLLSAHRVNDRVLDRLAAAYRQARYAPEAVTERLRAEARQALVEIDAQLAEVVRERARAEAARQAAQQAGAAT